MSSSNLSNSLWPVRMAAKILLGNVPGMRQLAHKTGLFRWGAMANAGYALKIFRLHMAEAFPEGHSLPSSLPNALPANFTALELGPGDSIASALVARAYGCGKIYLSDAGAYASHDVTLYKKLARDLVAAGLQNVPNIDNANTFNDVLHILNAVYLPNGLAGLATIPADSVDFIWSHSVLEHVRLHEFDAVMQALYRVLAPSGRISHNVDLKDHLGQALNNLRFSENLWEADWMAKSGFYTNRLRASQMMQRFQAAGFKIEKSGTGRWASLPTPRHKMAAPFNALSDDDLLAPTLAAVLSK